jgi:DNA polymerase I-like protein with 3'-5' exonuclease and polymerase domains
MRPYFKLIGALMRGYDEKGQTIGDIEQFVSGRIRGRTRYTAACNTFFQGLAADGAKTALYDLQKSCYLRSGALYGSRAVAFIHDEVIMEHPEESASERAQIQAEMMVKSMQAVCPDVKISASPALMRCWYKGADAVYDGRGQLIPWEPPQTSFKGLAP